MRLRPVPVIVCVLAAACAGSSTTSSTPVSDASVPDASVSDAAIIVCDEDGDGEDSAACRGSDCDDHDPARFSTAEERCDGVDNNCDGVTDQGPLTACVVLRIEGDARNGELGFRFGSPRDVDGDGIADIVAGARFTELDGKTGMGTVSLWSGRTGERLAHWEGTHVDGLFGHAVTFAPDLDDDGAPDVIAAAPNTVFDGGLTGGLVTAFSSRTSEIIWERAGDVGATLGWHLALTPDHDGDGLEDFVAAELDGRVHVFSARTSDVIETVEATSEPGDFFGWHVAPVPDLDGDGRSDLLIGAPSASFPGRGRVGAAFAFSTGTHQVVHAFYGIDPESQFGEMLVGLDDVDGDGAGDIAIASPHLWAETGLLPGEVRVYSGASGTQLHHYIGREDHELFGRNLAVAGDFDGDGVQDLAIGAPWATVDGKPKSGRFEIRSGRTGAVLFSVDGQEEDAWLGWHMAPASDVGAVRGKGLLVSALRTWVGGVPGVGALHLYLYGR